jgi:hypothetical protein
MWNGDIKIFFEDFLSSFKTPIILQIYKLGNLHIITQTFFQSIAQNHLKRKMIYYLQQIYRFIN